MQFKRGIRVLGNLYRRPTSIDDTGQRLALADAKAASRDKEGVATILRNVLATRVKSYQARAPSR